MDLVTQPIHTYHIPKNELVLIKELGRGQFGDVFEGKWTKSDGYVIKVAVKKLRGDQMEIYKEVINMMGLNHENIVRLSGIVRSDPLLMVIEYCEGGSLEDRLKSPILPKFLVSEIHMYSIQIACGMNYLSSNDIVHRDLAIRNILLTKNFKIAKICDFGLARIVSESKPTYDGTSKSVWPVRSTPPEFFYHQTFSSSSDVWSFAITLWEMYSYGEKAWKAEREKMTLQEFFENIKSGLRPRKPGPCPVQIFELMQISWQYEPAKRPNFGFIENCLKGFHFQKAEYAYTDDDSDEDYFRESFSSQDQLILIEERDDDSYYCQSESSRVFGIAGKLNLKNYEYVKNIIRETEPLNLSSNLQRDYGSVENLLPERPQDVQPKKKWKSKKKILIVMFLSIFFKILFTIGVYYLWKRSHGAPPLPPPAPSEACQEKENGEFVLSRYQNTTAGWECDQYFGFIFTVDKPVEITGYGFYGSTDKIQRIPYAWIQVYNHNTTQKFEQPFNDVLNKVIIPLGFLSPIRVDPGISYSAVGKINGTTKTFMGTNQLDKISCVSKSGDNVNLKFFPDPFYEHKCPGGQIPEIHFRFIK